MRIADCGIIVFVCNIAKILPVKVLFLCASASLRETQCEKFLPKSD